MFVQCPSTAGASGRRSRFRATTRDSSVVTLGKIEGFAGRAWNRDGNDRVQPGEKRGLPNLSKPA